MTLYQNQCAITRANGTVEFSVFTRETLADPVEHLVHLAVAPTGHTTVIDYDTHPNYHDDQPAHVVADKVKRFLEHGGAKFLGHPNSPKSADVEVERLKAKHGL